MHRSAAGRLAGRMTGRGRMQWPVRLTGVSTKDARSDPKDTAMQRQCPATQAIREIPSCVL